jgi:endonuclease/exonuclease/phosphatase family metal-dependent hydrolase
MRLVLSTSVGAWLTTWAPSSPFMPQDWHTTPSPQVQQSSLQVPSQSYSLNLLSYNAFLRPQVVDALLGFKDLAECRAKPMARALSSAGLDVVALQEAQHPVAMPKLLHGVRDTFRYQINGEPSAFAWADSRPVNGGNAVLSRYPIEQWYAEPYRFCSGVDCLARKGFVHSVVKVAPDFKVNVIGTHLNSGSSALAKAMRRKQFAQLRNYLERAERFGAWPIVLLGDLNVDSGPQTDFAEYNAMVETLSVARLGAPTDSFHDATRTGTQQELASSRNCTGSRVVPCRSPNDAAFATEQRRLDYVLFWSSPRYEVSVDVLDMLEYPDHDCGTRYLSDHKAPFARLVFHKRQDPLKTH